MQQRYIFDFDPKQIQHIAKFGAWETYSQVVNSAETNDCSRVDVSQENLKQGENTEGVDAFVDIDLENVKTMLDVGGGKYDSNIIFLKAFKDIDMQVWDPYNRSHEHNSQVKKHFLKNKVDAVSSMSVLNVIPECEVRLAHITTVKAALKINGKAYFKVWPGEGLLKGSNFPTLTNNSYQSNSYAIRFVNEIEAIFGSKNVKLDPKCPNLISAIKKSDIPPSLSEIKSIQAALYNDKPSFVKMSPSLTRSLIVNFGMFSKTIDNYLEENRHINSTLQHEYDKKFGLILYKK